MPRSLVGPSLVALTVWSCGTGPPAPGTLTILMQHGPSLTTTADIVVGGRVTREPAVPDLPLVVTVTTPTATLVDTAGADGSFSGSLSLAPDTETDITVSASDGTGSAVAPVVLSVTHDGTSPAVAQWSPANEADLTGSDVVVQVRFAEPIRPTSANISLLHGSRQIVGGRALSADSLTLTFTPSAPLVSNAIYQTYVWGATDVAGNEADFSSACFVTGGALASDVDPADDYLVTPTPPEPATVPTDLIDLRYWWYAPITMDTTTLRFLIRYTLPRSLDANSPANTLVVLDFDLDRDAETGVLPVKDLVLGNLLPPSDAGADYGILLLPRTTPADSSLTVIWTGPLEGNIIRTFLPEVCGASLGFTIPRNAIGVPVGPMHLVVYTEVSDPGGNGFVDAGPDAGYYTVPLPFYTGPPPAEAPIAATRPLDERTRARLRQLLRRD